VRASPELDETLAGTDYTPASELGRGTYTWRVRAMNDSEVVAGREVGAWSEEWAFTVGAPSPVESKIYLPVVARKHP
jgi:hypothetical protein